MENQNACLVRFRKGHWRAKKKDAQVTEETEARYASNNSGVWQKYLIAQEAIKAYAAIENEYYAYHRAKTLPFGNLEERAISSQTLNRYLETMDIGRVKAGNCAEEIFENYPALIEQARINLNGMFKESDYPTMSNLRNLFYWHVDTFPLPVSDLRLQNYEDTLGIAEKYRVRYEGMVLQGKVELCQRVVEHVGHMAKTLTNVEGVFRDSLVGNVHELIDELDTLNYMNDPAVVELKGLIQGMIDQVTPERLRNNRSIRLDVAEQASRIVERATNARRVVMD